MDHRLYSRLRSRSEAFRSGARWIGVLACSLCFCGLVGPVHASPGETTLVAKSPSSQLGAGKSIEPVITANGRYVLFKSSAPNLTVGDRDLGESVFLRDRATNTTTRLDTPVCDVPDPSLVSYEDSATISSDGRFIVMGVKANCEPEYGYQSQELILYDRTNGTARTLFSYFEIELGRIAISADGRFLTVSLYDQTNGSGYQIFLLDVQTGANTLVTSPIDPYDCCTGNSENPAISADGNVLAFQSAADNIIAGDTNGVDDIFIYRRDTGRLEVISRRSASSQGNGNSYNPSVSEDGRWIAYASAASNLVAGDSNGRPDIFLYDRQTKTTVRASVNATGVQGNGGSGMPSISGEGRFVAFWSAASNLVAGDSNARNDIFVRDRSAGTTTRVSVSGSAVQGNNDSWNPKISSDGRYVAYESEASNLATGDNNKYMDVFVYDRQLKTVEVLPKSTQRVAGMGAERGEISADGKLIVFTSDAQNLVAGDSNNAADVFVSDRGAAKTERVSVSSAGRQADSFSTGGNISRNGRFVVFDSFASNLAPRGSVALSNVFLRDRQASTTVLVSVGTGGSFGNESSYGRAVTDDGRYVLFDSYASNLVVGDTNGVQDVFVRDLVTGTTRRVNVYSNGAQALSNLESGVGITTDGRHVLFQSGSGLDPLFPNVAGAFVRDMVGKTNSLIYAGRSRGPSMSPDGRYVSFVSSDDNLVPGDTNGRSDVFVRDRQAGATFRVSLLTAEQDSEVSGFSSCSISADGRYVAFGSDETFHYDPTGRLIGITRPSFVHDRQSGVTTKVSLSSAGESASVGASAPRISGNGAFVLYSSKSTNLVAEPIAGPTLFVHELAVTGGASYSVSPSSLSFGSINVGATSAAKTVTVSNTGTAAALPITAIAISGTNAGQFAQTNNCGSSVPLGSTCTITVTFKPTSTGAKTANVTVTAGSGAGTKTVSLSGTGVTGVKPAFSVSPTTLAFGNVARNVTSAAKTVKISNTGTVVLPITSIILSGTNPGQFSQTNNCPAQVPVGGSCSASVKFKPTSTGAKSSTLRVTPGGGAAVKTVALSGTGI